jgi:hypothetical protein
VTRSGRAHQLEVHVAEGATEVGPRLSERFRGQGRAGSAVRRRNGTAVLRVTGGRRGRRSRLCRSDRRDLEALRGSAASIRRRQPARPGRRKDRISDRIIDPAGGAVRLRLVPFSFVTIFYCGAARLRRGKRKPRGDP